MKNGVSKNPPLYCFWIFGSAELFLRLSFRGQGAKQEIAMVVILRRQFFKDERIQQVSEWTGEATWLTRARLIELVHFCALETKLGPFTPFQINEAAGAAPEDFAASLYRANLASRTRYPSQRVHASRLWLTFIRDPKLLSAELFGRWKSGKIRVSIPNCRDPKTGRFLTLKQDTEIIGPKP